MFVLLAEEKALQHRLNRSIELDIKTGQLKNELQEAQEAALKAAVMKIQNATEATMREMTAMIEEGKEVLNNVKAVALNISRQGESAVVTRTHTNNIMMNVL